MVLLTHGPDHMPLEELRPVNLAALTEEHSRLDIVSVLDRQEESMEVEDLLAGWVAQWARTNGLIGRSGVRGPSRRTSGRG